MQKISYEGGKTQEQGDIVTDNNNKLLKGETALIKPRELTPKEQKRIQVRHDKGGDSSSEDMPDLFKIQNEDENDTDGCIVPVFKQLLSENEKLEEGKARMHEATGCVDPDNGCSLLSSMAKALFPKNATPKERVDTINRLGRFLREFAPEDATEMILAGQAISCNEKAMEYLYSAGLQEQHKWVTTHHNIASKLMARSQNAIQMLMSYRRGGQQKVTVEHVYVAAGGQAAFGNFETHPRGVEDNKENRRGTP